MIAVDTNILVYAHREDSKRIAALCKLHGVDEIWTADRDFNQFQSLTTINPLVSKG